MRERRLEDYCIGQAVWACGYGWGKVTAIEENESYPIVCTFGQIKYSYTVSGKHIGVAFYPSLFFEEIHIPESANIPKKWTPKDGENYYYISRSCGELYVYREENTGHKVDKNNISQGNCFKTEEAAQVKLDKILEVLKGE